MPDPAVVVAMREFKDGLLREETMQMQAMAREWIRVEDSLQSQVSALAYDVSERYAAGETVSKARLYRLQRYKSLVAQTQTEFAKYAKYADSSITDYQQKTGERGLNDAQVALQLSYLDAGSVGVYFNRLPIEAIENIVGMAGNGMPIDRLLRLRMVRDANGRPLPGVLDRLTNSLLKGTAQGINPRDVARMMQNDLTGGLNKALVIARSEGLRPYRYASQQQYDKSGVVLGHKRLCGHDGRVCGACLADEGTMYRTAWAMTDHPNGRCSSVPVVKGMPEVQWDSGQQWLRKQPEPIQQSILGDKVWTAWKGHKFPFRALVQRTESAEWGEGLVPATLDSLLEGADNSYSPGVIRQAA
jgi:hypothetical protein